MDLEPLESQSEVIDRYTLEKENINAESNLSTPCMSLEKFHLIVKRPMYKFSTILRVYHLFRVCTPNFSYL